MTSSKIILGVDPGTIVTGVGIISVCNNKVSLVQLNQIILHKYEDHYARLKTIFERTLQIIEQYSPNELAIEAPFYGKNVQSMLKLGRAQGTIIAACLHKGISITEYEPKKVKMAITGNGNSSKEQVAKMLKQMLKINELPQTLDATDALAVAVCHYLNSKNINNSNKEKYNSWTAFVKQNESRIK